MISVEELKNLVKDCVDNKKEIVEKVILNSLTCKALLDISGGNRKILQKDVERYYKSMCAGKFYLSNDMFCISTDGKLINGHNRSTAGSMLPKDKTFSVYIRIGVPLEELGSFDGGRKRDYEAYKCFKNSFNIKTTNNFIKQPKTIYGIARIVVNQNLVSGLEHEIVDEFKQKYSSELDYLSQFFPEKTGNITTIPIMAVCFKAKRWLNENHKDNKDLHTKLDKAIKFFSKGLEILDDTEVFPGRETLTSLVKYLFASTTFYAGCAANNDVFYKTMNFLNSFLNNKIMTRAFAAKEDLFPIDLCWLNSYTLQSSDAIPLIMGRLYNELLLKKDKLINSTTKIKDLNTIFGVEYPDIKSRLNKAWKLTDNDEIDFGDFIGKKLKQGKYEWIAKS